MPIRLHLPKNGKRLIYDLGAFGLPEIPYLAAQNLPHTTAGLPMHLHKGRMEINHILKGERIYQVGGRDYLLRGNEMFVTFPDEMHGSGTSLHGRGTHFWLQVELPRPGAPFLDFSAERARPLLEALWGMPNRHFTAHPNLQGMYSKALQLCANGPAPMANLELSTLLAEWFILVAKSSANPALAEVTDDIRRALDLIHANPAAPIGNADMAEAACLSESRFIGKFKQQIGMPPGEYLLRRRVEQAANALTATNASITDVAHSYGFSSSQHFSVTFKKFFGVSPQQWLNTSGADDLLATAGTGEAVADEQVRPWLDNNGLLHGYVPVSYTGGAHPC